VFGTSFFVKRAISEQEESTRMKVKDLIEKLKEFPDDMIVSLARYDFKYVDKICIRSIDVWLGACSKSNESIPQVHCDAEKCPYGYEARKGKVEERLLICWFDGKIKTGITYKVWTTDGARK